MKLTIKKSFIFIPLFATAIAVFLGASCLTCKPGVCGTPQNAPAAQKVQKDKAHQQMYTCPMHPQIVSDKPGKCPICGMNLVPKAPENSKNKDKQ
ncbi:MAG: heavy metal-binding domain-containing protein [Desulfobacteraceae bacterium]|nr:heavy metal-binding domain-containing protein [Desulfobacteraceae bacterium]